MNKFDVTIIGGGITGSSAAWFLGSSGRAGRVVVIEPDPTYEFATTPQSAGGVRQLFSRPENIAMSQFSLDFYQHFAERLAGITDLPSIGFRKQGYLFVVTAAGIEMLERNHALQTSMGARAELLDRQALAQQFPSIQRPDVELGCYSGDDGWIDPNAALQGFKRAALQAGVTYKKDRVVGLNTDATAVHEVVLESGETVATDFVVNAAGPWASEIAAMTGAELPIRPMCRVQHYWTCPHPVEALPLVKDEAGLFLRPEGEGFAGGCPSFDIEPGFVADINYGFFANYFEEVVWPMIASLVPKFEDIRLRRSWSGHYAQNLFDANIIIGRYSKQHANLVVASGFSGHGLMQAPAVGRALSELVLDGSYQTLDLSAMGIERVWNNRPYPELGIR